MDERPERDSVESLFSTEALSRLRSAGWRGGSSANVRRLIEFVSLQGFVVGAQAELLIEHLQGFVFSLDDQGEFEFDVNAALSCLDPGSSRLVRKMLGEDACPIGAGRGMCLAVGRTGRTLLLSDQWLGYRVTSEVRAALDWVVLGRHPGSTWVWLNDSDTPDDFGGSAPAAD